MQLTGIYQQGALVLAGFLLAVLCFYPLARIKQKQLISKALRERKEQFVALASHYLLTPITIIQTAISRLQESDAQLTAEQRRPLYEAIVMGQQRLWIIAEQLVLVNQIDENELRLHLSVGDVSETVSNAVADMDLFARHKKIGLHLEDNLHQDKQARFDSRRLRQAIIAVLDNAIKFSMEDSHIGIELSKEGGLYTIRITDQGIGMAAETMRQVTEKFYRGSGIYNFDYEGIGLGLHIAYAIIRQHQGNITFDSLPKKGTSVIIQFPSL